MISHRMLTRSAWLNDGTARAGVSSPSPPSPSPSPSPSPAFTLLAIDAGTSRGASRR
uniref:Uncharacterized protein n=1 Tax=uncultured marine virus TaxID=186617 RepID=A0A0F7L3X3_9VIRU|nr:hypothetical protein [uncultured marine virus]